jgi:hypothetical protein
MTLSAANHQNALRRAILRPWSNYLPSEVAEPMRGRRLVPRGRETTRAITNTVVALSSVTQNVRAFLNIAPPSSELPPSSPMRTTVPSIISRTATGGPATAQTGNVSCSSLPADGSAIYLNASVSWPTRVGMMIWNKLVASFAARAYSRLHPGAWHAGPLGRSVPWLQRLQSRHHRDTSFAPWSIRRSVP